MRRSTLKTCAAALALAALTPVADADAIQPADAGPSSKPVRVEVLERGLLAAINGLRARRRLPRLREAPGLRRAAATHSLEMARLGYFEHESADGTGFWRRIARFYPHRGFRTWNVGENLASASPTLNIGETVSDWLDSPGHRQNLLDPDWREAGIAAVYAESAPGEFDGEPAVIVTLDLGYRRR
jgi:uncharacterized protein YkwD